MIILAIVFFSISKRININVDRLKIKHKIQNGKIIYSDLNVPAKPFFSKRYRICGKPDYIVIKDDHHIPVEVKTGEHHEPKKNHIFQLAAYCQMLEENYGSFVPYGILVYNDTSQQYKIPFNPKLRFELESSIKKMRLILKTKKIVRNHNDPYKCKSCSLSSYCNKKII